jgi:ABC-type multidrug transport system permease subunit
MPNAHSAGKRLLLSLFLGFAAGGVTSYLIALVGVVATLLASGANSATAPGMDIWLRLFALPISIAVGILVFVLAFRRANVAPSGAGNAQTRVGP